MRGRRVYVISAVLLALGILFVEPVLAQIRLKIAIICIEGNANANGSLNFKIVPRDQDCSVAQIFGINQGYDGVAGGVLPTAAQEVRDAVRAGLTAGAPGGYTIASVTCPNGAPGIRITGNIPPAQQFDVCVDGVKIIGAGLAGVQYTENGLTVTGFSKVKSVPGLSSFGFMGLGILLVLAGLWIVRRRNRTQVNPKMMPS